MCFKFGFHCRCNAPPAGNLERSLISLCRPQHTSFISSGLRQRTRSHECDACKCRMPAKVSNERHLQIADAREQDTAANDVVGEERFRRGREYSGRSLV